MSGPLFDQYKSALRRGHVASLAGRLDEALEAYREAARLVPERALPLTSQGTILHRLKRGQEADEVFERALALAPDDEAALRGRGTAREDRGQRSGAAADFEHLALVLARSGRTADALDAARRADELQGSTARIALLGRLTEAVARAEAGGAAGDGSADAWPTSDPMRKVATEAGAAAAPGTGAPPTDGVVAVDGVGTAPEDGASWPAIDLPSTPLHLTGPTPDPEALVANAAALIDSGDLSAARDLMLSAAMIHRQAGRLDAALDVSIRLLEIAPGDPQVHLAIANVQLDRGWLPHATEKIKLLRELVSLTGDTQGAADIQYFATERLDEAPARSAAAR